MSRLLSVIGILVTVAYVAGLWWFFDGRLNEIKSMSPNNIGDFLAGVFGPLAILWLVLGFFQQGIELRQNTRALDLQAEELHNSVEQQRNMVEISRKQMEAELETIRFERERQVIAARPKFVFHDVSGIFSSGKGTYNTVIKNLGNTATDVVFVYEPEIESSSIKNVISWAHGERKSLDWCYKTPMAEHVVKLSISYIDAAGTPGIQSFELFPTPGNIPGNIHTTVRIAPCMA